MIYLFIPYYHEDTKEFRESLNRQEVNFLEIRRDRKRDKIYWTRAVNDFWKQIQSYRGIKDDDVIVIMNNDIMFTASLFVEAAKRTKQGSVVVPYRSRIEIDWAKKKFTQGGRTDSFVGRCFFITYGDFKRSGGFCKLLPHALADIDYGLKLKKKGITPFDCSLHYFHPEHEYEKISAWSLRNYGNPVVWTIFLLRHPNKYTLLNIAKAWYDALFRL